MLRPHHALHATRLRALADDLTLAAHRSWPGPWRRLRQRAAATCRALSAAAADAVKAWRQRAVERASRRELGALSDAMLRDLGIARGEIDGLAAAFAGRIDVTHPRLTRHDEATP